MSDNSKIILGIDVAKHKLDVALIFSNQTLTRQFANSATGFKLLAGWLSSLDIERVHACLEATGTYSEAVAEFLHTTGHLVSVVNPFRIKGYSRSKLTRNKTDQSDARLIAEFCLTQEPAQWFPLPVEVKHLQALVRRIETLQQMNQMEQNRLETSPVATKASIQAMIQTMAEQIEQLTRQIKDHLDQHPDLKKQSELLQTIPGIGEKTANLLLSEIQFARFASARQVAAQAGVTPQRRQSGTSLNTSNLSKLGNRRVRKALYFPAITALGHNEIIKEFAKRLARNGKTSMQIICAAMRKLLHIAFGVLKHNHPFDPNLAFTG